MISKQDGQPFRWYPRATVTVRSRRATQDPKGLADPRGLTVTTPDLPDDERAQRLARLREGKVELTDDVATLQDSIATLQRCNQTKLLA
jgi:hypothetical protein